MQIEVTTKFNPTVEQVLDLFEQMDNLEHAEFFNKLAIKVFDWKNPFEFQVAEIARNLSKEGIAMFKILGQSVTEPNEDIDKPFIVRAGQKVRVIANVSQHKFEIGEEVVCIRESLFSNAKNFYLNPIDYEEVKEK